MTIYNEKRPLPSTPCNQKIFQQYQYISSDLVGWSLTCGHLWQLVAKKLPWNFRDYDHLFISFKLNLKWEAYEQSKRSAKKVKKKIYKLERPMGRIHCTHENRSLLAVPPDSGEVPSRRFLSEAFHHTGVKILANRFYVKTGWPRSGLFRTGTIWPVMWMCCISALCSSGHENIVLE